MTLQGGFAGVLLGCCRGYFRECCSGCYRGCVPGFAGCVVGVLQVCRRLLHCSQLKGEQKSEGDPIWSKKETLTTQKGDPIFVFFRTVRKGGLQHKKETQRAPKSTKRFPGPRGPPHGGGTRVP